MAPASLSDRSVGHPRLDEHFRLPPMPRLLARLLDVLSSERVDASRAAAVIERDPALSAEILKVVNSAYYSLPRPVSELRFAIAYLGLSEVGRIALTLMTVDALKPKDAHEEAALRRFWFQSYLTTLAAREVLRHVPGVDTSDDLYSAALLHRLGVLAYQRCCPDDLARILEVADRDGTLVDDAARSLKLAEPRTIGAQVAEKWRLPATIVRAAGFYDLEAIRTLPDRGGGAPFDIAICVGSLVVEQLLRPLADPVSKAIETEVCRVLGWTTDDYVFLLGEGEEWKLQAETYLRGG